MNSLIVQLQVAKSSGPGCVRDRISQPARTSFGNDLFDVGGPMRIVYAIALGVAAGQQSFLGWV